MERILWSILLSIFFLIHEFAWWRVKRVNKPSFIMHKILRYSYILRYWAHDHAVKDKYVKDN